MILLKFSRIIRIKRIEFWNLFYNKLLYGKKFNYSDGVKLHFDTNIIIDDECNLCLMHCVFARNHFTCRVTSEDKRNKGCVVIGSNTFFNENCSINCMNSVLIGNDCLFGENVHIYDHNHSYKDKNLLIREQGFNSEKIVIGDNCWIGSNVVILKGVTIGKNSIIGAGCVVYKSVPDNSILLSDGHILNKE